MRESYHEKFTAGLAVLDLQRIDVRLESYQPHDVRLMITRLNVPKPYREQGAASRLLTQCCADADRERETLWLEFQPYTGTDPKRLHALYERFGFTDCDVPGLMRREPTQH